jgi:tellurite resistance protein
MSEWLALVAPGKPLLDHLPIGPFGSLMELTGLSVAWRLASARYGVPEDIALGIEGSAVISSCCWQATPSRW